MLTLNLKGRPVTLPEPVFKQLKIIISAYNTLATATAADEQTDALNTLLTAATLQDMTVNLLKEGELTAFLTTIPTLCQLETGGEGSGKPVDWGSLYAHLSACYGWTYNDIDNHMTLSRLDEYRPYMQRNPPTHQLAAAYLGYEYQDPKAGNAFLAAIAAKAKAIT